MLIMFCKTKMYVLMFNDWLSSCDGVVRRLHVDTSGVRIIRYTDHAKTN